MRMMLWTIAAVVCLVVLTGCGGGGGPGEALLGDGSHALGTLTVRVTFPPMVGSAEVQSRLIPAGTQSIVLLLARPTADQLLPAMTAGQAVSLPTATTPLAPRFVIPRSPAGGTEVAQFRGIPVGPASLFVGAYSTIDGSGPPLASQEILVVIRPATTTYASIELESTVEQVLVSPPSLALDEGGVYDRLQAQARDADGAILLGATFQWSSDDPSIATVASDGQVTAGAFGDTVIRATEEAGGIEGTCQVQVVQVLIVSQVVVQPDQVDLDPGDDADLAAAALDQNGDPVSASFTWSSDDPSVATVDAQGQVHAVAPGTTLVRATETVTGLFDTAVVIVHEPPRLASIAVTPLQAGIAMGATIQLAATPLDQFGAFFPAGLLAWQSDDEAIAAVDTNGLVTGVAEGQALVRAVHPPTSIQGASLITVTFAAVPTAVAMSHTSLTLAAGETAQLTAEVLDQNDDPMPGATVNWGSEDPNVATVDQNGLVTAGGAAASGLSAGAPRAQALTPGTHGTIIYAVEPTTGARGEVPVTVVVPTPPPACVRVEVAPASPEIVVGASVTFTATAYDEFDQVIPGATFTWSSSGGAATIGGGGVATGVAEGQTQITATYVGAGCSGATVLTVTEPRVLAQLVIDPSSLQLKIGESGALTATALDQYGDPIEATIGWRVLDPTIAGMGVGGLNAGTTSTASFEGLREGSTAAEATADGITASAGITVTGEHLVAKVVVTPNPAEGMEDTTVGFTAEAFDDQDQKIAGANFVWSSSNGAVAWVGPNGVALCKQVGVTQIRARETKSDVTGEATLTVKERPRDPIGPGPGPGEPNGDEPNDDPYYDRPVG